MRMCRWLVFRLRDRRNSWHSTNGRRARAAGQQETASGTLQKLTSRSHCLNLPNSYCNTKTGRAPPTELDLRRPRRTINDNSIVSIVGSRVKKFRPAKHLRRLLRTLVQIEIDQDKDKKRLIKRLREAHHRDRLVMAGGKPPCGCARRKRARAEEPLVSGSSGRNPSSSNSTLRRSNGRVRLLLGSQPRLVKPRISMRDWLLAIITVVLIPLILRSPFVGLLAWVWFAIMNPHRLAFGWARDFP